MLFPISPLDFVEAIERERRESLRIDAHKIGLLRRLAQRLTVVTHLLRKRRASALQTAA